MTGLASDPSSSADMPEGGAAPESDGAAPAAALNAAMVKRGRNPWWGKDQNQPRAEKTDPARAGAGRRPPSPGVPTNARARMLLDKADRKVPAAAPEAPGHAASLRARLRPGPDDASQSITTFEEHGPPLLDRFPEGLLRDIGLFAAVFVIGCALMLYLSLTVL